MSLNGKHFPGWDCNCSVSEIQFLRWSNPPLPKCSEMLQNAWKCQGHVIISFAWMAWTNCKLRLSRKREIAQVRGDRHPGNTPNIPYPIAIRISLWLKGLKLQCKGKTCTDIYSTVLYSMFWWTWDDDAVDLQVTAFFFLIQSQALLATSVAQNWVCNLHAANPSWIWELPWSGANWLLNWLYSVPDKVAWSNVRSACLPSNQKVQKFCTRDVQGAFIKFISKFCTDSQHTKTWPKCHGDAVDAWNGFWATADGFLWLSLGVTMITMWRLCATAIAFAGKLSNFACYNFGTCWHAMFVVVQVALDRTDTLRPAFDRGNGIIIPKYRCHPPDHRHIPTNCWFLRAT